MRLHVLLLVFATVFLAACDNKPSVQRVETPPEETPTPQPEKAPEPVVAGPVNPPAPPERRLAPEGVFYLVQRISVTTEDGISGVAIGTQVKLVAKTNTGMRVTDGQREFDVLPSQVTNDLDAAARLIGAVNQHRTAAAATSTGKPGSRPQPGQALSPEKMAERAANLRRLQSAYDNIAREEATVRGYIAESIRASSTLQSGGLSNSKTKPRFAGQTEELNKRLARLLERKREVEAQIAELGR